MKVIKLNNCPFCGSITKWCGENEPVPEENHLCHQIVCTNRSCAARFDFDVSNQKLLPDETDDMTEEECMEPFRIECANRFNARRKMGLVKDDINILQKCSNGCGRILDEDETYICQQCNDEIDRQADEVIGNAEEDDG